MAFAKYAKTGTHHGRVYACTRCTYFNDLRAIKGHVVSRHLELEEAPYFCRLCHLKCYAAEEWVRHANSVAHRLRVMVSPSSVSKNTLGRSSWELNLEGDNPDATRWGAAESERYFSLSASVRPKSSNYQLEDLLAEVPLSEPPAPAPAVAEEGYEPLILDEASWIQHTTETEADPHAETIPPSPTPSVTPEPDAAPDQRSMTPEAPEMGRPQQLGCAPPAEVPVVRPWDQRSVTPEAPEMGRPQQLGCAPPAEVPVVRPWDQRSVTPEAPEMGRPQQLGCAGPAEVTVVRPSVTPEPDAAPDQRSETPEAPEMGRTQQLGCAAPAEVTVVRPSVTPEPDAAPDQRSETPEAPEMGRTQQLGCAAPAEVTVVRPSVTPEPDAAPDQRSETPEAPETGRTQQLGCAAPAEVTVVRPSVTPEPDAAPDQRSETPEAPEMGRTQQLGCAAPAEVTVVRPSVTPEPDAAPDQRSETPEAPEMGRTQQLGCAAPAEVTVVRPSVTPEPDAAPDQRSVTPEAPEMGQSRQVERADPDVTPDRASGSEESTSAASAGNLPTLEVGQSSPASDEVPDSTPEGVPPVGEEVEVMDTSLLQMHNADSSVTLDVVSMSDRSTSASPSRPASKVVQDPALEGAPPVGEEPEVTLVDADPGKDRSLAVIPQQEKKGAPATGVTHRRPILEMLSEVFPVPPPKPRTAPRSVAPCEVQLQRLPPKPTSYYITMDGALIPQGPETSLRVCQLQQCCDLVSRSVHRALAPMLKKLATEEKEKRSLQELLQELHASNKELRKSNDELLRYLRRKSSNKRTKRHHQEETPELKKRKKHRET